MNQNERIFKSWLEIFNSTKKNELEIQQKDMLLRYGYLFQNKKTDEGGHSYPTDLVMTEKGKRLLFNNEN